LNWVSFQHGDCILLSILVVGPLCVEMIGGFDFSGGCSTIPRPLLGSTADEEGLGLGVPSPSARMVSSLDSTPATACCKREPHLDAEALELAELGVGC